jgi:hypothetical protein
MHPKGVNCYTKDQRLRQVAADSEEVRKLLAHIEWMRDEHYLFLRRGQLLPHRVVAFTKGSRVSPFPLLYEDPDFPHPALEMREAVLILCCMRRPIVRHTL